MRLLYWVLSTVMLALLIHIITVFWVPTISGNQAFSVLNRIGAQGGLVVLPEPGSAPAEDGLISEVIPYQDPYITTATCRFDLDRGPLVLRGRIVSPYWSFTVHRANGAHHYGLTQSAIREGRIHIELRNAAQVRARILDPDAPITDAIQVELPFNTGIVLIKSLSTVESQREAVRTAMEAVTCRHLASQATPSS